MIFRINKTEDFTIMSNRHFKEKGMSLKAKGLLSLMFSLPDNWDYSIKGLVSICKENESAVKSALNELKQFGYLKITKEMPNNENGGRINYIYDVFEIPIQEGKKQGLENLPLENQSVENQGQLNTNNQYTNNKTINNTTTTAKKDIRENYDWSGYTEKEITDIYPFNPQKDLGLTIAETDMLCKLVTENALERYFIKAQEYPISDVFSTIIRWAKQDMNYKGI